MAIYHIRCLFACIGRAPHDVPEPTCLLGTGRIRYSVSGQLPVGPTTRSEYVRQERRFSVELVFWLSAGAV
jgi:hypothetical protein